MSSNAKCTYSDLKKYAIQQKSPKILKDNIRKEFRDRVRKLRAENLFNVRKISGRLQKLRFIKNALFIEMSGLTSTDIINIIEEVEEELRMEAVLNECDVYEKDSAVIIEAMLKDVIFCPVCNVILNQNVACDSSNFCEECTKSVSL